MADSFRPGTHGRFRLRLILFTLPFALVFLCLSGFLFYTGETIPLSTMIALQMNDDTPIVYQPKFAPPIITYKVMSIEARRPEVIALGSSRVMQMRSMFFNRQPRAFYNAGGAAFRLDDVDAVLHGIAPGALPQIVIVGLDQTWFNDDLNPPERSVEASGLDRTFSVNRSVIQSLVQGEPVDIALLLARRNPRAGGMALGWEAIIDGHGMRNDGSLQFTGARTGEELEEHRQEHFDFLQRGRLSVQKGRYSQGAGDSGVRGDAAILPGQRYSGDCLFAAVHADNLSKHDGERKLHLSGEAVGTPE